MALTLAQTRELSLQSEVANRVVASVWKAAYTKLEATPPDPITETYTAQVAYAKTLLACDQQSQEAQKFIRGVVCNATVQAAASVEGGYDFSAVDDGDIDYIVQSVLLSKFAG